VSAARIKNPAALYGRFWLGDCGFAEVFIGDLHLFLRASWSTFALRCSRFFICCNLFHNCAEALRRSNFRSDWLQDACQVARQLNVLRIMQLG
jgi:hypothetical protein